jgi:15-cis-phytoene synthase
MNPDQYCQQRAAASGSSFYYSFLFLPESRRRAITALYAFCREVDDVVDELADPQVAMAKLAWWRGEVAALFAGTPQHPVTRALQPFVAPYRLTEARMNEVIDGMAMDLEQSRYADFDELERYCQRVAGVVGEMAAEIFGYVNPRTLEYARSLGIAFQLTNIIRDVGEDARRGRIYLPQQDLARFGVADDEILQRTPSPDFEPLMRFQAERARSFYRRARDLLPPEDRRAQRPGLVMAAIYRALLGEIEADRFRVLDRRIALTPLRKLWIAWRCWVFG